MGDVGFEPTNQLRSRGYSPLRHSYFADHPKTILKHTAEGLAPSLWLSFRIPHQRPVADNVLQYGVSVADSGIPTPSAKRTPTRHPTLTILKHTMPRSEPGLLVMCFNMEPFQATIKI